jgi:two-component system, LytTR family, sensor kinase
MALVKSQLNPHFLFNTLNNIDILIAKDAEKASDYLNKLSDIMRFMLYETKTEQISLQKEWAYLEKYIELQKIRTANPNFVQYTFGRMADIQIAPMTLIPFVENAFKHAEGLKADNTIVIHIRTENNTLFFDCQNKYPQKNTSNNTVGGLGNELIIKRLDLLYGKKCTVNIVDDGAVYGVKLVLYLESMK